jgi:hypothetical protein
MQLRIVHSPGTAGLGAARKAASDGRGLPRRVLRREVAVAGGPREQAGLDAEPLVAFVVEIARGHSGWPYSMIGAVGGVAYLAAVIVLRIRG